MPILGCHIHAHNLNTGLTTAIASSLVPQHAGLHCASKHILRFSNAKLSRMPMTSHRIHSPSSPHTYNNTRRAESEDAAQDSRDVAVYPLNRFFKLPPPPTYHTLDGVVKMHPTKNIVSHPVWTEHTGANARSAAPPPLPKSNATAPPTELATWLLESFSGRKFADDESPASATFPQPEGIHPIWGLLSLLAQYNVDQATVKDVERKRKLVTDDHLQWWADDADESSNPIIDLPKLGTSNHAPAEVPTSSPSGIPTAAEIMTFVRIRDSLIQDEMVPRTLKEAEIKERREKQLALRTYDPWAARYHLARISNQKKFRQKYSGVDPNDASISRNWSSFHSRPPHDKLAFHLAANAISLETYNQWKDVLGAKDFDEAYRISNMIISQDQHPVNHRVHHIPYWVLLHLALHKVNDAHHASGLLLPLAMERVIPSLPLGVDATERGMFTSNSVHSSGVRSQGVQTKFPVTLQPALLVITAAALARYASLEELRQTVKAFLSLPHDYTDYRKPSKPNSDLPTLHFNLLLSTFSQLPRGCASAAVLAVALLRSMESRVFTLTKTTYIALLHDRFVVVELTKMLRTRMLQEKIVPTAKHLEAYLRLFAGNGLIHDEKIYHHAIQSQLLSGRKLPKDPMESESALLVAASDQWSAFHYLHKLLDKQSANELVDTYDPPQINLAPLTKSGDSTVYHPRSVENMALLVAAKNIGTTTHVQLMKMFGVMLTKGQVNAESYKILTQGLFWRGKYDYAIYYFIRLTKSGLDGIDVRVLAPAVRSMAMHPTHLYRILTSLEELCGRSDVALPLISDSAVNPLRNVVVLNTKFFNGLFSQLVRARRPDVVFVLWEYTHRMYKVHHDDRSLEIFLEAAILAENMDDSADGTIALFKDAFSDSLQKMKHVFFSPGQRQPRWSPAITRREAIAHIRLIIGQSVAEPKGYVCGRWRGMSAVDAALQVFAQIVLAPPSKLWLCEVADADIPARPVLSQQDIAEDRILDSLALPLPDSWGGSRKVTVPWNIDLDDIRGEDATNYTGLTPTDACFRQFILLLCLSPSRVTFFGGKGKRGAKGAWYIPRVLTWMRAWDVYPSQRTLAIALTFWSQVSLPVLIPLEQQLDVESNPHPNPAPTSANYAPSEYTRLLSWIENWLGIEGLPKRSDMVDAENEIAHKKWRLQERY